MKKMFTLATGLLLAIAVLAADRRPVVTVKSMSNYRIVIDGKSFYGDNTISLSNFYGGRHTIQVYENRRSYFGRREKLVASSSFQLRNRDLRILVDRFGQVHFREMKRYGRYERDDRDWDDRDWNDRDRNDRDFDGRDRNHRDFDGRDRNDRGRDDHNRF